MVIFLKQYILLIFVFFLCMLVEWCCFFLLFIGLFFCFVVLIVNFIINLGFFEGLDEVFEDEEIDIRGLMLIKMDMKDYEEREGGVVDEVEYIYGEQIFNLCVVFSV